MTPLQAIHKNCVHCMGGNSCMVRGCDQEDCPAFLYRNGKIEPGADRRTLRAIRRFCLQCAGSVGDANHCTAGKAYLGLEPCPLYPFRKGKNPNVTAETRDQLRRAARKHCFLPAHGSKMDPESTGRGVQI